MTGRGGLSIVRRRRVSAPVALLSIASYLFTLAPRRAAAEEAAAADSRAAPAASHPAGAPAPDVAVSRGRAGQPSVATSSHEEAAGTPAAPFLALPTTGFGSEATNQAISLPQQPATVAGMGESFNVSLTTGAASLQIPVSLPPARGSAQAHLAFVYDSSAGRGLAGMGWDFGNVFIGRELARGIPQYNDPSAGAGWQPGQDRFVFGSDELVPICLVSGDACAGMQPGEAMPPWADGWQYFRPAVERSFLRFFWSPDRATWRAQAKSGVILEFGNPRVGPTAAADGAAVQTDPDHPTHIFKWYISREFDASDAAAPGSAGQPTNVVVYRYLTDAGTPYLQDVYDTPPAVGAASAQTTSYAHHVHVTYESRPDPSFSYQPGWLVARALRIARIDVTSQPFAPNASGSREIVRRYELEYDPQSHASLLASIQVEGRCAFSGEQQITEDATEQLPWPTNCPKLPAMTLGYTHVSDASGAVLAPPPGFEGFEGIATEVTTVAKSPPYSYGDDQVTPYDINADGLPDVLVTAPGLFGGNAHGVFLNGVAGQVAFSGPQPMTMQASADSTVAAVTTSVLEMTNPNVAALDVDGDGLLDLLHMPVSSTYTVFSPIGTGNGFQWAGRSVTVPIQQVPQIDFTHWTLNTRVMDVDGDGLVDIVHLTGTEADTYFGLGRFPGGDGQFGQGTWTGPASAQLSLRPAASCVPWSATPVRFADPDTYVADMNGDSLPDIVRVRKGDIRYWPGRGNGFWGVGDPSSCPAGGFGEGQEIAMAASPRYFDVGDPIRLDDVNGDGLADLVRPIFGAIEVWLNVDGTGWTSQSAVIRGPYSSQVIDQVRLLDINGSGTKDVVWGAAGNYQYVDLQGGQRPLLLSSIQNGLGKTTTISYRSSVQLMLEAAARNTPWASAAPMALPVVTRVLESDNLSENGALGNGAYETDYSYADAVYDGQRREFRGFRTTTVVHVGDAAQPTEVERTVSLLGQCVANPSDGYDVCAPSERWRDNPREALKGLPSVRSTTDGGGVTFSTAHHGYTLQSLYSGLDGRSVRQAFESTTDTWVFETSPFATGAAAVSVVDLIDLTHGGQTTASSLSLAGATFAHLQSAATWDNFGDIVSAVDAGCVDGGSCSGAEEALTKVTIFQRSPLDVSGWAWRSVEEYVSGSFHPTDLRHHALYHYDAAGHLQATQAVLAGTVPLVRSNGGGAVASTLESASADGVVTLVSLKYDSVLGNLLERDGAAGRCRSVSYDATYGTLPTSETVFAGAVQNGCGSVPLTTRAEYDRGLGTVTASHAPSGEISAAVYDGFGRPVSVSMPDPNNVGLASPLPSWTVEYLLPGASPDADLSVVHAMEQDGADPSVPSYHEKWTMFDGLGRARVAIEQADPSQQDAGPYVVGGLFTAGARSLPMRRYRPFFWSGAPLSFPLRTIVPDVAYTQNATDALGRTVQTIGLDGLPEKRLVFHALSVDAWDAEDLAPGPHQGTFSTARTDGHGRKIAVTERIHARGAVEAHDTTFSYLPSGEVTTITRIRVGSKDAPVVRWIVYDSLGRRVLNADPDTTPNSPSAPPPDLSTVAAWRYAYDDAGALVGTSDARGCGENFYRDGAGRLVAEDYSPCQTDQAPYSLPNVATGVGLEVVYLYDTPDPANGSIRDAAGRGLTIRPGLYAGRIASISDRANKTVLAYDGRGRITGAAKQLARAGAPSDDPADRYAPRWYVRTAAFDAADRVVLESTGSARSELAGAGGESTIATTYSARGMLAGVAGSYGALVAGIARTAEGLALQTEYGDAAGTKRTLSYDSKLRPRSRQTYRGRPTLWSSSSSTYTPPAATPPSTLQLLLEDVDVAYDGVGNVVSIRDWRLPEEWPAGAQPATKTITYDDLYRVTSVQYEYPGGTDPWTSPFAAEDRNTSLEQPIPHVGFATRTLRETFAYDWIGNTIATDDDSHGFYDRSLGTITNGGSQGAPYQLVAATNQSLGGSFPGNLVGGYDVAGNLTRLIVQRGGTCIPTRASCSQEFAYQWDELGRLVGATRWDLLASVVPSTSGPLPTTPPAAQLAYTYDASGQRVRKTATDDAGNSVSDLYVFASLDIRRTAWDGSDYELSAATECPYLIAGGQRVARVAFDAKAPSVTGGSQHVYLFLDDALGSTSIVIDQSTGELVEAADFSAYGSTESDYRPDRWDSFREHYRFTGKEDDVEVGLVYFGQRYYVPALGRWASPDPAAIHNATGDLNPYAYVGGRTFVATDPTGELAFLVVIAIAAAVGALVGGGTNLGAQAIASRHIDWGSVLVAAGVGAAAGALIGATAGSAGMSFGQSLLLVPQSFVSGQGWVGLWNAVGSGALIGTASAGLTGANASQTALGGLLGAAGGAMGYGTSLGTHDVWDAVNKALPRWLRTVLAVPEYLGGGKLIEAYPHFASAMAALNGGFSGGRSTYNFKDGSGFLAFAVDSTWSLDDTMRGNVLQFTGSGYDPSSAETNRTVFQNGLYFSGFAHTQGNVSINLSQAPNANSHEGTHVLQSRIFGPTMFWFYGISSVVGGLVGIGVWAVDDSGGQHKNFFNEVEWYGYYENPFEQWAYEQNPAALQKAQNQLNP
jgi:RHS repeat-associated protein